MKRLAMMILLAVCVFAHQVSAQRMLTLEKSKKLALQNNCAIKNSQLEIDAARQTKKAALTNYFPSVSAGGAIFRSQKPLMEISTSGGDLPVYDGDPANLKGATQFAYFPSATMALMERGTFGMLTAVQPVFAGGRIINGNKLASLGEEVSEYKKQLAREEVLLSTETQYWLMVSLDEKRKTIGRYEELLNRLAAQVDDAYRSGVVMRNDLLKVRVKRSEVLVNKAKLENGRNLAMMAFCQSIGVPYDSTLVLVDTLDVGAPPEFYVVDNRDALKNRAEMRLLGASVRAEELQSNMKLGEYLPQAGIGVTALYMKLDQGESRNIGMVFGTVSIPISGWWGGSHELEERSIHEEIAQNNMRDKSDLLLLQMEKSRQDVTDAYKQLALSEEANAQAEENLKVNQDGFANGMIPVSDLLEAQAMAQQTRDQIVDARSNYRVKVTTYISQTGRYAP